jgi:hypothetical protein
MTLEKPTGMAVLLKFSLLPKHPPELPNGATFTGLKPSATLEVTPLTENASPI